MGLSGSLISGLRREESCARSAGETKKFRICDSHQYQMFLLWPIQTNIEIYLKRSTLLYYSIFDKHCKNITVKVLMT